MSMDWLPITAIVIFVVTIDVEQSNGHQLKRGKWKRPGVNDDGSRERPDKLIKDSEVYLVGGSYQMGSSNPDLLTTGEFPIKNIRVKPFSIDRYLVTNADFMAFKHDKSRYVTDAERVGYSWVFSRQKMSGSQHDGQITPHKDGSTIWQAIRNATWSQPFGPGSSVYDKPSHPVVHVSYYDAYSYCVWAGRRLTTEYEWEFASRAGKNDTKFPWGNESATMRSNLWQGRFPDINLGKDGYDGLSPVDAFQPQNEFGLYDMIGNVWEWTSTVFTIPRVVSDPGNPEYTIKGGSYMDVYEGLTGHEVRNSARRGFPPNYSAVNLGFRCSESGRTARPPVRHRLEDTWDYKVKQVIQGVVGSMRQSGQFPDEL